MTRRKTGLLLVLAATLVAATARVSLRAQGRGGPGGADAGGKYARASVQDALHRPFTFSFAKPTPLDEVVKRLGQDLQAPVALDRSAIDRLGLKVTDEVQLELEGVRLKTGLKLLLDQLDLTFKVIPEDNLLVITDETGSDDPVDRVFTEVKSLHRDLHDLQDAVDEIRAELGIGGDPGAKVRKPTIIEEMPAGDGEPRKPKDVPPAATPPRTRPGA